MEQEDVFQNLLKAERTIGIWTRSYKKGMLDDPETQVIVVVRDDDNKPFMAGPLPPHFNVRHMKESDAKRDEAELRKDGFTWRAKSGR